MAEFMGCKDESVKAKNSISPPQVAKRSNIRLGTNLPFTHDSIRGRGSSLTHADYSPLHLPQRQQYICNSPYHIPLIEESTHESRNSIIYESDRPGTPALGDQGDLIVDDAPSRLYRDSLEYDENSFPDSTGYQRDNYSADRHLPGGIPRDPNLVFPPTAAPPTSPSQLYALLLQRNIRPQDYTITESRPQAFVPNHLEWSSNIYQTRSLQKNDYRRDLRDYRERERIFYSRLYGNARPRYDQYSHVDRRPFLNQNYTRLPYNMVRIKNSNDDDKESNSMNGFTEDDEGNHECHDLHHNSVPGLDPPATSVGVFHQNGTLPMGTTDGPEPNRMPSLGTIYQGEWPMHRALWMSGPSSIGEKDPLDGFGGDDTESIMSFSSSTATMSSRRPHTHQLGTKVEMVYSLLSMLGSCNKEDMSRTLLEMSGNQDSCIAMRQSGCLPLLIQLLHGSEGDQLLSEQRSSENVKWAVREARRRASQALHNIVHAHPDDRRGRREARVLRLLEQIRDYSDFLRDLDSSNVDFSHNENLDLHPGPAIAALMKLSFDEEHRHAMCQLGGLQAIAELIQADHEVHGNTSDQFCVTVRRYAGMALTNLTFGDGNNKALLCSMKPFMQALVAQLYSPNEDLRQVTASVLRNLSWRADASSKQILREVGVVITLMKAAMEAQKESTLKSILSALWNLSAHCSMNKADICEVEGALEFLVSTLTYKSSSSTLSIIENGGGILRNISSHIAVREDYRVILRRHKCLQTLLSHLKSPSLTIVSNACGTLWNLSARCAEDQQVLWEMGAVGMLRNLIHSKHKMISMGSSAALKNLLAARPEGIGIGLGSHSENGHHLNGGLPNMPSLLVRKQRALAADLDENLAETCDNIDSPKTSPTPSGDFSKKFSYETNGLDRNPQYLSYLPGRMYHSINGHVGSPVRVPRSESKDSLGSSRSEPPHYKAQRERFKIFVNNNRIMPLDSKIVLEKSAEWKEKTNLPFEGNSNVVLQMFRHLQSGNNASPPSDIQSNGHSEPSAGEDKPAIRPNSLPPPRKGVGYSRNNRISERNGFHNGFHRSGLENCFDTSRVNGYDPESTNSSHSQLVDNTGLNDLLEIPGNKRTFPNSKQNFGLLSGRGPSNIWRSGSTAHNQENRIHCADEGGDRIKNVVMRPKKSADVLSSSVTTLGIDVVSDDQSVGQTPLVISRCSSLSSLTSCFQHSARSSWVSDVSQRTSAVISPSDLPDSPGYCTSEERHRIFEFTDKIPEADAHSLIRPRPAWPMSSLPSNDSLPSSIKRMSLESDVFVNSNEAMHSETITDQSGSFGILESPATPKTPPPRPQNSPLSPEKDQNLSQESSSSQENKDEENENDLVEACVNLGMPSNMGQQQQISTTLHSKISNLFSSISYSHSSIPIKSRLTQSFPAPCKPDATPINSASQNHSYSIPGTSQPSSLQSSKNLTNSDGTICDDNDNLLVNSGNINSSIPKQTRQMYDGVPQNDFPESERNISQAFLSKCLNVCKKYPALSQKSSFDQAELRQSGKIKTSIPQIVRVENPNYDTQQHPRQLQIKSQSLPVYTGISMNRPRQDPDQQPAIHGNSSSTEENVSEDNILSSSPSACDESEGQDSDYQARASHNRPGEPFLRNNRVRSRKSKANRRSMEIRPPSEQSSEDDNKNAFSRGIDVVSSQIPSHVISVPSSESEEKVKEDERTKEKVSRGVIPDLLEGAAYQDGLSQERDRRLQNGCIAKASIPRNMTDSMELRRGALLIASELEEGLEDYTHSSTSFDLENMKPPSCMGEMSMTSSGLSDLLSNGNGCYINGKRAVDRRRNIKRSKKISSGHRFVFKSVRQTIAKTLDVSRQLDKSEKPASTSTSMENISMKSSGTSDLIENINPPSVLDDLSMTNSCASLNSISSDILESRSQSLADPRSNSEMFQRLNAAAAMVQVYSRELSNIMTGSMKSSCNSDCLDLVKPPSIFQDIAEVTMEDGTEILSDPLVSDFELEEELPHDDEPSVPSTETIHSPFIPSARHLDGSADNLNSSVDGDSLMDKEHFPNKRISTLAMEPQNNSSLNSIQNPSLVTDDDMSSGFFSNLTTDDHYSIEKDDHFDSSIPSSSPPAARRGPRIVKPINRETVRQMQEKKNAEKSVKSIRGKVSFNSPRNLLQQVTSARVMSVNKSAHVKTASPSVSGVRPTRTSALRASQNKQTNLKIGGGRMSPRSFLSKPPSAVARSSYKVNKQTPPKPASAGTSDSKVSNVNVEIKRPNPPVKQNTFTKDDPVPKVPANTEMPSKQPKLQTDDHNNNDKVCSGKVTSPLSSEAKIPDRKHSLSSATFGLPLSNSSLQRKLSAPIQRRNEKSGMSTSPSSQSITKIPEKKSPSSNNLAGRAASAVGSRTASTNSLSSLSSNSLSVKKQNSQKDVPSKISSIWKRSESSSSANSPVTDSSSAEKQLSGGARGKVNAPKNVALRCSSVTTPPVQQKGIPRSSTYEKIAKTNSNQNDSSKSQNRATTQLSGGPPKPKQSFGNVAKNVRKFPSAPAKSSGGPRIVKPVTPRPKPHAITSKTLRQSGNFSAFSETRNYSMSSGPPSCISSGRNYGNSQDPKASIPLVTAPFAYMAKSGNDSNDVRNGEDAGIGDESTDSPYRSSIDRRKSDSEDSGKEDV